MLCVVEDVYVVCEVITLFLRRKSSPKNVIADFWHSSNAKRWRKIIIIKKLFRDASALFEINVNCFVGERKKALQHSTLNKSWNFRKLCMCTLYREQRGKTWTFCINSKPEKVLIFLFYLVVCSCFVSFFIDFSHVFFFGVDVYYGSIRQQCSENFIFRFSVDNISRTISAIAPTIAYHCTREAKRKHTHTFFFVDMKKI